MLDFKKSGHFWVCTFVDATSPQGYIRAGAHAGRVRGLEHPLNGNRLNTNLLLTFVKTQNNSAHAYIAIERF